MINRLQTAQRAVSLAKKAAPKPPPAPKRNLAAIGMRAGGVAVVFLTACGAFRWTVLPLGEQAERAAAAAQETAFALPVAKRPLPNVSVIAPLPKVLEYAFNASGAIEAAYCDWRAALARVPQAGALEDPRLDFTFMFDSDNLGAFRAALDSFRLMASQDLPAVDKRDARAAQALAEAQAAGERFRAAKYALQRRVVQAYADLALNRDLITQTSETLRLLELSHEVAAHRYHQGGMTVLADLRKIEVEIRTAESAQRALFLKAPGLVAALNGLLNRAIAEPVGRVEQPAPRGPLPSEAELLARAAAGNPNLAALRRDIEARGAALTLAELQKKPDYVLAAGVEDPLIPALAAGMTLPINRARIRAAIDEALAMRQAAEARLRDARFDTQARLIMALARLRDAERAHADFAGDILPKAQELLDAQLQTYRQGGGDLMDILDTKRLLVDFRKMILQAQADRAAAMAEIEEIAGDDLFGYLPGSGAPSAAPAEPAGSPPHD